jgi:hypothetical protein
MTPDEIAKSLELASLTHQLAVSAAYEELRTLPRDDPRAKLLRHSLNVSYGRFATMPRHYVGPPSIDWSTDDVMRRYRNYAPHPNPPVTLPDAPANMGDGGMAQIVAASRVTSLPVKPRTSWTTLKHLNGRRWATSSGFGPGGAWSWILETVAHEHGVSEDQIGNREGVEDEFEGDDLVTIDGVPVYRIDHLENNR